MKPTKRTNLTNLTKPVRWLMSLAAMIALPAAAQAPAGAPPDPNAKGGPPLTVRMGLGVQGEFLFSQHCAACHVADGTGGGADRAPHIETLRQFPPERIHTALSPGGKMEVQGSPLTDAQRRDVAEWLSARRLGAAAAGDAAAMAGHCTANPPLAAAAPAWNGWSPGTGNARFQDRPGLAPAQVPHLRLAWAFGIPNGVETYSQPTVYGGRVFLGSDTGQVYALDAKTGCVHWSYLAAAGVRSAPLVAPLARGRSALLFADMKANVYAIDALTGREIWHANADNQPLGRITGAVAYSNGRVFVGTSSSEEISGMQQNYECCRYRGTVVALDAATGRQLWKFYTLPPAQVVGKTADGRRRWSPAGVGIWSAPTIDAKRGLVYVGTGDNFTDPASPLSDAVVALDMKTGKLAWSTQATVNDVYMTGCSMRPGPNCPQTSGPDADFGSSIILQTLASGKQVLIGGHKGGEVVALDPDARGKILWRTTVSGKVPGAKGEIVYGGAADHAAGYYALQVAAALTALDLKTGQARWRVPVAPPADRPTRTGSAAGVSVIPGIVFSGGWDGVLRAFDAANGHEVWSFDTVRDFDTVNRVKARGGSFGAPGATIAGGMVYVGSGYVGTSNGMPGNVLLAFAPK